MPNPADIHDPQFEVVRVLHNDQEFSVAYGCWESASFCLGIRWNGAAGRLGYPVGRHRQPKFLVLPELFTGPMLQMLAQARLPGTDQQAVALTRAQTGSPSSNAPQLDDRPHPGDRSLRMAKWHLDNLMQLSSDPTVAGANLRAELADVVTVFAAASVEGRLNTFIASPLLHMAEKGSRRFLGKLITGFMRLNGQQKIKFLREQVPSLKDNAILKKVLALAKRRNQILHTSFQYDEEKALPDQPYVSGLHDHLPETAFVQRPVLRHRRAFGDPLEQATEDYQTVCEFHELMRRVIPYEPWPPSSSGAE